MKFEIVTTENFRKEVKALSKKYPSLKKNLAEIFEALQSRPEQGISLGKNCFKIRLGITSKGKGKSGGARVITHIKLVKQTVYLVSIYDKSDFENISDQRLKTLLKIAGLND